jgi:hypothetical protein
MSNKTNSSGAIPNNEMIDPFKDDGHIIEIEGKKGKLEFIPDVQARGIKIFIWIGEDGQPSTNPTKKKIPASIGKASVVKKPKRKAIQYKTIVNQKVLKFLYENGHEHLIDFKEKK